MKNENILEGVKSKSIKEIKEEINQILSKFENQEVNLSESIDDYQRLINLNKIIEASFKKRAKDISLIGKKRKKI